MKAKVAGAQKPMEQFSVKEVQNWFETFDKGFFKQYAKNFARFDGDEMMKLSPDDCKERCPEMGDAIYNEWHQKVTGIFFPQLFADFSSIIFLFEFFSHFSFIFRFLKSFLFRVSFVLISK